MIFQLFLHLLSLLWRGGYRQNQIEQGEVAYNLCLFYYNLFAIPISQTGVQRPPLVPKKEAVDDRWSLFKGSLYDKSFKWGLKMLVVIDTWSLLGGGR